MKQLKEKVAIVTGAGQGIGKGIALCLAKRGVKVIATGRRAEPIEQTIAEIKELGGEGFAMTCDSADRARVEEVVKAAAEKYGTVDVVVNNAQAIVPSAPVEETSYDNMLKAWAEKFPEEYAKQVNLNPMKRFGDPEIDIAPVIAFLAGPDSCYFSGQSVIVDGANSIMP